MFADELYDYDAMPKAKRKRPRRNQYEPMDKDQSREKEEKTQQNCAKWTSTEKTKVTCIVEMNEREYND